MTDANTTFRTEILEGLQQTPKTISSKWLYDDRGSELFEDITRLEAYYPTRTEAAIFDTALPETAEIVGRGGAIVEFGSGASIKIKRLIEATNPVVYLPVDIAEEFMAAAVCELQEAFPALRIMPTVADMSRSFSIPALGHNLSKLGFFPGSTIGNFPPDAAIDFLKRIGPVLGQNQYLLISADMVKDIDILERAYDDPQQVTAAFNLNLLTRINRELEANFDNSAYEHVALFNEKDSRIEMHLRSRIDQTVQVCGEEFYFTAGELVHTENSYKYTREKFTSLLKKSGWQLEKFWTDEQSWFGVYLAKWAGL